MVVFEVQVISLLVWDEESEDEASSRLVGAQVLEPSRFKLLLVGEEEEVLGSDLGLGCFLCLFVFRMSVVVTIGDL